MKKAPIVRDEKEIIWENEEGISGKCFCLDGVVYDGEFKDGQFHGEGTYTFPDGKKFIGQYVQDMELYTGGWKDDKYHGQGILTYSDGTVKKGEFRFGEFRGESNHFPRITEMFMKK